MKVNTPRNMWRLFKLFSSSFIVVVFANQCIVIAFTTFVLGKIQLSKIQNIERTPSLSFLSSEALASTSG